MRKSQFRFPWVTTKKVVAVADEVSEKDNKTFLYGTNQGRHIMCMFEYYNLNTWQ